MKKSIPPFYHLFLFLAALVFLAIGIIQKHIERIQISYQIGHLKKNKILLMEEKKKLEARLESDSTSEILLKKTKLLGLALVPEREEISAHPANPETTFHPAEGASYGQ